MNTRTLIAGDTSSPVILHVPHASRVIPPEIRPSLTVTDDQLAAELDEITDAHTDVIAQHAAQSVTLRPWTLRNDLSRLVIDPERFPDEREQLNAVGRGAVYTRTCNGDVLRNADNATRDALLDNYFHPYAAALSDLVTDRIAATDRAVIIDVHSYPTLPSAYELHPDGQRPALCIGTDPHHTPPWLVEAAYAAFSSLEGIGTDTPFSGTYVPLDRYNIDRRVYSVMIELRRDQYLTEKGEFVDIAAENLGAMLGRLVVSSSRRRGRSGEPIDVPEVPRPPAAPRTCEHDSTEPAADSSPPRRCSTRTPRTPATGNDWTLRKQTSTPDPPNTTPLPVDKPSCALNSARRTIQVREKSCSIASKQAKRDVNSRSDQSQDSPTTTQRTMAMTENETPTLTQEQREAFWRRRGWTPELPDNARAAIEREWDDLAIEEAEAHGF